MFKYYDNYFVTYEVDKFVLSMHFLKKKKHSLCIKYT